MQGYGNKAYFDFEAEMRKVMNQLTDKTFKATQAALKDTGRETSKIMTANTVSMAGSGQFQRSWTQKDYKNAVYVYNSRGTKGTNKGIPISNLAEYSARGPKPFVERTFNANKSRIFSFFIRKMEQNISKQQNL